jgi:GNAT superfamily N-acetyltransferase
MQPSFRIATRADTDRLVAMQERSMRALGARFYAPEAVEAAVVAICRPDPLLLAEGGLLVLEVDGHMAGCAGATMRAPNYARHFAVPPPRLPGRIGLVRTVFVDPDFARMGLGRLLMETVERRIAGMGGSGAELMATLSGVPLYGALGYVALSDHVLDLGGVPFPVRRMAKALAALRQAA